MLVDKLFETNGMVTPCKAVMASTMKYKDNQDNIGEFVKQRIVKMEGAKIKKRDVLAEYQEWYAENESENHLVVKICMNILIRCLVNQLDWDGVDGVYYMHTILLMIWIFNQMVCK